jgi:hypothetical protein
MASTPQIHDLTAAYVSMLATATGRPFADTDAPGGYDTPPGYPYGLVTHIAGGSNFGDTARPNGMATVVYQVTAVGARVDQAEWLADAVAEATLGLNSTGFAVAITVSGLTVINRLADTDGGVIVDGGLANSIRRYGLTVCAL